MFSPSQRAKVLRYQIDAMKEKFKEEDAKLTELLAKTKIVEDDADQNILTEQEKATGWSVITKTEHEAYKLVVDMTSKKIIDEKEKEYKELSANVEEAMRLAREEEERELLLEKERVAAVLRAHEELHPPETATCPICLEDFKVLSYDPTFVRFFSCCGNLACECGSGKCGSKCPLCRANLPDSDAQHLIQTRKQAEKGNRNAQRNLAGFYLNGQMGVRVNMQEYIKWLKRAAEQKDAIAMHSLSQDYFHGTGLDKSEERAYALLEESSDLGNPHSQKELARKYYQSGDNTKAVHYATLAVAGHETGLAELVLGTSFWSGPGVPKSLYRAKHYLELAVRQGEDGFRGYYPLGSVLLELYAKDEAHDDILPKALFWLRKSTGFADAFIDGGDTPARKCIKMIEDILMKRCHYCCKEANQKVALKNCAKCKSAWYCSKECQVSHWKAGHKSDCIKHDAPVEAVISRLM